MSAVADHLRAQAKWCDRLGSPFTARLLEQAALDLDGGGIVAELIGTWQGDCHGDALALRLAGALHAAVLSGRDPELAAVYPDPKRAWDMGRVWPLASGFLRREAGWVRAFMQSPPQTNEVGRAGALAPAFLWLGERAPQPFHMLELGASAGLNLSWDRFRYAHGPWGRGGGDGPLIPTEFDGNPPGWRTIEVSSRRACDRAPMDPDDAGAMLRAQSYVWPDQFDRLERLKAAIRVARDAPWRVERADADAWLEQELAGDLPRGVTVIYHSIFYQYPPVAAREAIADAIEQAGRQATAGRQLAWVRFEPESVLGGPGDSERMVISVKLWDGSAERTVELGEADPHGWRVRWVGGGD